MSKQAEWTILVFLNAKNNLEPWAFPNFQQMASVGSTPEVNVVVEMGRPRRHHSTEFGAWSKTLRFFVEKGTLPIEEHAISDLGDTNMGSAASLAEFVTWGRKAYPAKRTLLVIWNHGQGWRVPAEAGAAVPSEPAAPYSGYRYVSNDDDTGDKLYNRAIQDTLKNVLGGERLDVLGFDACLMSMVESAYAFRDIAQVMVGSEELEPPSGWNYARWLEPLVEARGAIEAPELGRLLVRAMKEEYGDTSDTTQSAAHLVQIPGLVSSIRAFAQIATPMLGTHLREFRAARSDCKNYGQGYNIHSIDLGHYMEQIEKGEFTPLLKQAAADVRARVERVVIENYASKRRQGAYGSTGLAIYYPNSRAAYDGDPDREGYDVDNQRFPVEFVQTLQWARFLREYWQWVPRL